MPKRDSDKEMERLWKIARGKESERRRQGGQDGEVRAGISFIEIRWTPKDGDFIVVTPETDIRNSLVIEYIEAWQKAVLERQPIPQPQKIKGSRKLDWKPVWEWSAKYPQVTRKEISQRLNRSYTQVKRKLKELDEEMERAPFSFQK